MKDCIEITVPFVKEVASAGLPIQILGGLGSAAVSEAGTTYCPDNLEIVMDHRPDIPRLRPNGSLRDLDVLVVSTDPAQVEQVEEIANSTVGDQLKVAVFGLHTYDEIKTMQQRPFSWLPAKAALSDRYVVGRLNGYDESEFFKAVFPFGVSTPQSALETWYVVNHGEAAIPIPVAHPAMMILNDLTRSIAGMRKKYDKKIMVMTDNLWDQQPDFIEWMVDGPGSSQMELAGVLRSLGWLGLVRSAPPIRLSAAEKPSVNPNAPSIQMSTTRNLSIKPPAPDTLINHPAFLLRDAPLDTQKRVMALARVKSSIVVGTVERHFQDLWEKLNLENLFKRTVRNK